MRCEARGEVAPSPLGVPIGSRRALGSTAEPVDDCRLVLSLHVSFEKHLSMYRRWAEVGMLSHVHG